VSPPPLEAQQLFVLASDEVDSSIFQQSREDKQQAHSHPDVNGLHIGDLQQRHVLAMRTSKVSLSL
ncbi:uncharacterized, partial [Tachysurus ichikawai]